MFPFALPCFAPTAVPQVLQLPSGSTLPSADSSVRPFPPLPPCFVSSTVLPLRSRPVRTPLLGLCFFLSLLQASASQWLPLCRSRPPLSFVSSGLLLTCPPVAFFRPLRLHALRFLSVASFASFSSFAPLPAVPFRFLWSASLQIRYSVLLLFFSPLQVSPHSCYFLSPAFPLGFRPSP